jgi:hypothetical protein
MPGFYEVMASQPGVREHVISLTGTGAADPTKNYGQGVAVTRTGAGAYLITWAENPGRFVGWTFSMGATTPGDVAGHTAIRGAYNSSAFTLAFVLYSSSFAAHDLAALEEFDIICRFKTTSV